MIELMLEAERALGIGLLDNAERLYRQVVAADPRNAIAVTGLARVALERGDQRGAYTFARRALALDPDNPMASHLSQRMAEQMRNRGESLPDESRPDQPSGATAAAVRPGAAAAVRPGMASDAAPATGAAAPGPAPAPAPSSAPGPAPAPAPVSGRPVAPPRRPGLVDRLLRRRR